jgi:hypothetical protein
MVLILIVVTLVTAGSAALIETEHVRRRYGLKPPSSA